MLENQNLLDILNEGNIEWDDDESPLFKHSPYYDFNKLITLLQAKNEKFTIMSINIQSLQAKFDELKILTEILQDAQCSFTAICVQETWLSKDSNLSLLKLPGYLISEGKSSSLHGGVAI